MIGADRAARAAGLGEEPAAPVRAEVVEGDDLALVVEQRQFAERPVEAQEITARRQLAAMGEQVPAGAREVRFEVKGRGHSVLAGAA